MGNGIKIGEVDSDSAIIWTRLTATPERNTEGQLFPPSIPGDPNSVWPKTQPDFPDLSSMQGSLIGASTTGPQAHKTTRQRQSGRLCIRKTTTRISFS
jgi:phosphodiesterase/alkaline phosphatase D-like protein